MTAERKNQQINWVRPKFKTKTAALALSPIQNKTPIVKKNRIIARVFSASPFSNQLIEMTNFLKKLYYLQKIRWTHIIMKQLIRQDKQSFEQALDTDQPIASSTPEADQWMCQSKRGANQWARETARALLARVEKQERDKQSRKILLHGKRRKTHPINRGSGVHSHRTKYPAHSKFRMTREKRAKK